LKMTASFSLQKAVEGVVYRYMGSFQMLFSCSYRRLLDVAGLAW
jgi:hypothetical protein